MRKRIMAVAGALAALGVGGALALAPSAHAASKTSAISIPTSCTVIPLFDGLQITLCL